MDAIEQEIMAALRKAAHGKWTEVGFFIGEGKERGYQPIALIRKDRTVLMVNHVNRQPPLMPA